MEEESRARSDLGGCSPEIDRRGMAGEACGTLKSGRRVSASSVLIRRNQPSVGELLLGCNPEILCIEFFQTPGRTPASGSPLGGITCALKSTGVAHSQQASLRQDIDPVIQRSWVPLRPEPHSEPGGGPVPSLQTGLRNLNPELLSYPSSLVGGRPRPRRPFTDPFSSLVPSWGDVPEADSKAVPMVPLRRLCSCFFDNGPLSEIREGDLANMRWKYAINPSVGMRSPTEFERAPYGGAGEVAVYEAYLEAGFWGVIPSLIGKVSSSFGFCPSKYSENSTDFMSGANFGSHRFCHLRSRDGTPPVEEPSRGVRGNYPFGDDWNSRYVFVKIQEPVGYPMSWCTVDVSRSVSFAGDAVAKLNGSSSTIPMGDLPGEQGSLVS
ncbi:hypothetical protein F2Q69_00052340 [Brassica cretica]|uniref:Uncharacterized protein n=1 Tax=Brassica cretica TaxID=69181 RepID=A0A8S9MU99_BRACR|nr:hypothetical protein F2Q69_00052340 [Brassica cretica]